jgi:hypothetical protein
MSNFYHKVAVVSACTALGFALGANKEAKAATFSLPPTITSAVIDIDSSTTTFDGLGDTVYPYIPDFGITVAKGTAEFALLTEFNIGSFSFAPNTVISSVVLQVEILTLLLRSPGIDQPTNPGSLGIFGYVGNGTVEPSDFEAGVLLNSVDVSSSSAGDILDFDVTPFIEQRVSNSDAFAGFGIRALNFGGLVLNDYDPFNPPSDIKPRLIVKTIDVAEPVPEPTTIFGSTIGLCLGGWLKRKKLNQKNKTTYSRKVTTSTETFEPIQSHQDTRIS